MAEHSRHGALPIAVTTEWIDAVPVVTVVGELDLATAPTVREPLAQVTAQPVATVILDLTDLTFCGSAGLTELLTARERLHRDWQGSLILAGCRGEMRRILQLAGVQDRFRLAGTMAEAILVAR